MSFRKPRPQHWYNVAVGRSGFQIGLNAKTMVKEVSCELYISGRVAADTAFELLEEEKDAIEDELGWIEKAGINFWRGALTVPKLSRRPFHPVSRLWTSKRSRPRTKSRFPGLRRRRLDPLPQWCSAQVSADLEASPLEQRRQSLTHLGRLRLDPTRRETHHLDPGQLQLLLSAPVALK